MVNAMEETALPACLIACCVVSRYWLVVGPEQSHLTFFVLWCHLTFALLPPRKCQEKWAFQLVRHSRKK